MIPYAIADEVELWARKRGRHARMEWNTHLQCPVIHFTSDRLRRAGEDADMDRALIEAGVVEAEATESVRLQEWDTERKAYVPLDLEQYGVSGIINLLESMDTWSGRGTYRSPQEAVFAYLERNAKHRETIKQQAEDVGREEVWLHRRSALGLPYHTVGIDLKQEN